MFATKNKHLQDFLRLLLRCFLLWIYYSDLFFHLMLSCLFDPINRSYYSSQKKSSDESVHLFNSFFVKFLFFGEHD